MFCLDLALTLVDLDGLYDLFESSIAALGWVAFVLAVFVVIGVVQRVIDRMRSRVKILRTMTSEQVRFPSVREHGGAE